MGTFALEQQNRQRLTDEHNIAQLKLKLSLCHHCTLHAVTAGFCWQYFLIVGTTWSHFLVKFKGDSRVCSKDLFIYFIFFFNKGS